MSELTEKEIEKIEEIQEAFRPVNGYPTNAIRNLLDTIKARDERLKNLDKAYSARRHLQEVAEAKLTAAEDEVKKYEEREKLWLQVVKGLQGYAWQSINNCDCKKAGVYLDTINMLADFAVRNDLKGDLKQALASSSGEETK